MATLLFTYEFDDLAQFEAVSKGYLGYARVQVASGKVYPVYFYDPVRLHQDLEEMTRHGEGFIAEPGLIVVGEVTLANMQLAVDRLECGKFFEALAPVGER